MTDSDPGGPDLGRIPSPLDQRRLAEAREMEQLAEAQAAEQTQPRLRTQASGTSRRLSRGGNLNYTGEVHQLTRLLEEAQHESQQLREMLDLNGDQLGEEKARIERLEERLRNADARYIAHDVARQKAEMEAARSAEEAKRYKVQLELALREIQKAQDEVDAADDERNKAEEAAARARDRERKLIETIKVRDALEQGRAEGRQQGLREGMARGQNEGRMDERQRALAAFRDWLDRKYPDGVPEGAFGADSPIGGRRRPYDTFETRLQQADAPPNNYYGQNSRGGPSSPPGPSAGGPSYGGIPYTQPPPVPPPVTVGEALGRRSRAASVSRSPAPQLPPQPIVPDSAPIVQPPPMHSMVSEQRLAEPMTVAMSPTHSRPASRASRVASRAHTPIQNIPDGFIPVLDENSRINLPPPHEVQPTRGVLPTDEPEPPLENPDFGRLLSRQQSRVSMRGANPVMQQPSPRRVLDPAFLYEQQPGVPPPAPDPMQPQHSLNEIRGGREYEGEDFGPGSIGNDYGSGEYFNQRGPSGPSGPSGRLSRIDEAAERAVTPISIRYAAAQALPASRAPSNFGRSRNGSVGAMSGEAYQSRERLRQELRNSDPNIVEELISNQRSAPSETYSGRSSRPYSNIRRPAQINVPAPLAPGYGGPVRQPEDSRSRISGHSRSASMAGYPPAAAPPSQYGGERRRAASVSSTQAPTIVIHPPTPASQTGRERTVFQPDVPELVNRAPSPARSTRGFAAQPITPRAPSRPASVYNRASGFFRGNSGVDPSVSDEYQDRFGGGGPDPTAIPLPHSVAPSFAPLPQDDVRTQHEYQGGRSRPSSRPGSRFGGTPGAAQYPLPPSDSRTEYGRTPTMSYSALPSAHHPQYAPARPLSRQTIGSQALSLSPPMRPPSVMNIRDPISSDQPYQDTVWGGGGLSAMPRAPSRAQSMRAPGSTRSNYPPLPEEDEAPLPRPASRVSNMGPNGFVMPGMGQSSKFYEPAASDRGDSPQPVYPRSSSRMSTRSNARGRPYAENEVDMASLATGGQSLLRTAAGVPMPLSRPTSAASNRTLKSALKQTPNRRNISISEERDDREYLS